MNRNRWPLIGVLLLFACGDSEGSQPSVGVAKGTFVDSAVEGLEFSSGELSGVTDEDGTFEFELGTPVLFQLGDIILGLAEGAGVLTPIDLVDGAEGETHPTVTNLARFLQTIDVDGDPDNGILITDDARREAIGRTLNFAQSIEDFANDPDLLDALRDMAGGRELRSAEDAQDHLARSVMGLLAGLWEGTYGGALAGTWRVTVTEDGTISGTGIDSVDGEFGVAGHVLSNGEAEFGSGAGVAGSAVYQGKLRYSGTGNGTWSILETADSGSWQGSQTDRAGDGVEEPDEGEEEECDLPPMPTYILNAAPPNLCAVRVEVEDGPTLNLQSQDLVTWRDQGDDWSLDVVTEQSSFRATVQDVHSNVKDYVLNDSVSGSIFAVGPGAFLLAGSSEDAKCEVHFSRLSLGDTIGGNGASGVAFACRTKTVFGCQQFSGRINCPVAP